MRGEEGRPFVVELLASSEGIGFLMVWGRQLFQLDVVFVCIVVIGAVGVATDAGFARLDAGLIRWPRPALGARRRGRNGGAGAALALPILLLALWSAASARGWVAPAFLPSPLAVWAALRDGLADGSLLTGLALSLRRAALGLAIGGTAGFAVGMSLGLVKPAARLFGGALTVLRLVAIFAWLPLITAWTGLGESSKVAFVAIACFFPVQVTTERGVAGLSPQLAEAARALRLTAWQRLRLFVLPGAAPAVFAGLRLALTSAWVGVVGAEYFMASGGGLGSQMIAAQQLFKMDVVAAGMALIGLVAALLAWLGNQLEAFATRWRHQ